MAPEVDKTSPRRLDLLNDFPAMAPEVDKTSKSRQNQSQEARFDDFPAMAPEVDKTSPRTLDLMIFEPWIQESTKQWLS